MKVNVHHLAATSLLWCSVAHSFCFDEAASLYGLNSDLLRGIAQVESGMRPDAINLTHYSRTHTVDIGPMQINSGWLPTLARYGISRELLQTDPCVNVRVGAWILARTLAKEGATWNGVGAYNAACVTLRGEACTNARKQYATKVAAAMHRFSAQSAQSARPSHAESQAPVPSRMTSVDVASAGVAYGQ